MCVRHLFVLLTFKSVDLEMSFLVCRYAFIMSRSSSSVKTIRSGSRSLEQRGISVCPVWALTFKCFNLQISFWYTGTSSEHLGQGLDDGHGVKVMVI